MILITGGLGFIGLHTARALLDLGQPCVLTRYRSNRRPSFLKGAFVEPVDVNDRDALLALGRRYEITGIVNLLSGGFLRPVPDLYGDVRTSTAALLNVLEAAREWQVSRLAVASAIGVYAGAGPSPWREDIPLPLTATYSIELMKKWSELLSSFVGRQSGIEVVNLRIGGIYGPLYRNISSPFGTLGRLVHAAVGRDVPAHERPYADDGIDWCYVKDCGRAIALLQTVDRLAYDVYNVGAGHPTTNAEFVAAIRKAVPDARIDLPPGRDPAGLGEPVCLDTGRLHADTGFTPAFDATRGIADYVAWLRAGNDF
jgi:UDP-glucose 4-epimerase